MSGRAAAALVILAVGLATVRCSHAPRSTCTTFLESPQLRRCAPARSSLATPMFHGDRARLGWNAAETILTPAHVGSPRFGSTWSSPPFDDAQLDDGVSHPHMYASPLYVDGVTIVGGDQGGRTLSILVAATSNAWVYAVNAFTDCSTTPTVDAGTILWRTRLGAPKRVEMDGRMALGVLSTPVIDLEAVPPRLYVVSVDASIGFQAFALDLASGAVLAGWPVTIDDPAVRPINANGPALFAASSVVSQRGALALSPKGDRLYVPFGAYNDGGTGWLVSIDTRRAALASAFSMAPWSEPSANGGMWGAGGPAIDANGVVYGTTGNSPEASVNATATWGNSLLAFAPGDPLALAGAYSPWNRCLLDAADIDIGAGSPMIVPDLDPAATSTPHLVAFGGKQGNVYLVDRDRLASRTQRTACTTDPASDLSLLPPEIQPPLGARGPLNVFGPYAEDHADKNFAKMRTAPAYFRDAAGASFLFVSGSTKAAIDSTTSVPPSIARLRIVLSRGAPAYLATDAVDREIAFVNPGSPVVSSNAVDTAIVWVVDENAERTASLVACEAPGPVLYAAEASTLRLLFRSPVGALHVGGKYVTPIVAHGAVFVGTDRIQAFGIVE